MTEVAGPVHSPERRRIRERTLSHPEVWFAAGIFILLAMAALRLAADFFLPVFASALLALLLAPLVRWMSRVMPAPIASAIVMLAMVVVLCAGIFGLARPAASWVSRAPETLAQAQRKISKLTAPLYKFQRSVAKVQEVTNAPPPGTPRPRVTQVEVAPAGLLSSLSGTTIGFFGAFSSVMFLTFFLLATGARFGEKFGDILPERHRRQVIEGLRDAQEQMSRYLSTSAMIRVGLGTATWALLTAVGLPNPALWGVVAGVLNFIPYLGSLATLVIIAIASLVTFDTTHQIVLAIGGFLLISLLEGNVVSPILLGHRLPLNAVSIFVGLLFWGWIWGIAGAVLAVPLTVLVKVVADRVRVLEPVAVLLDS